MCEVFLYPYPKSTQTKQPKQDNQEKPNKQTKQTNKQTNKQTQRRFKNQGLKVMVLYSASNSSPIFAYGLWLMAYGLHPSYIHACL